MLEIKEVTMQPIPAETGQPVMITVTVREILDYPYDYDYDYPVGYDSMNRG